VGAITQKATNYRESWKQHIKRMPEERIPKQIMKYQSRGYRCIGCTRRRRMEM
jgi:hypothetical protein